MKSKYNRKTDESTNITQIHMKSKYNRKIDELTNITQIQNNKITELSNINHQQNNKINELNYKIENLKEIINEIKIRNNHPKLEINKSNFNDSLILNKNNNYISNLNKWINQRECQFKTKLLFRKSINGNSYNEFHRLYDKQGKTLVLIQTDNNLIIGEYTSKDWDTSGNWHKDNESLIFSFFFNIWKNFSYQKKF